MRKILLLSILVIITAIFSSVNAAVVTEAEARAKANSFIAKRTTYNLMTKSRATQMQYAWDSKTLLGDNVTKSTQSVLSASVSNEPTFYVYSNESSFVIVSGESTTREILGFSNEGGISSVENLPAPMKEYLSGIDAEIKSVRANNNANLKPTAIEDELGEYRLLETAIWDQEAPFNKNASNGLSGCVPTAFAIIMRYHQWPLQGKVATLPSGSETIDLSSHTYDWSKMPLSYLNGYTEEQGNAVAQLMSDLGQTMGAAYNLGSTDVNVTSNIGRKFQQNFDYTGEYDLSQKDVQYSGNEAGWIGKIIESIDNNCPIPYSGTRTSGSGTAHYLHMFVLDGYSENNYFHFNWGWGGDGNGWFTLSTMGPSADRLYTQSNKAYFNLAPNKATYAISASASPATAGVVSINGGTSSSSVTISTYENSVVTLTAEANDGYTFKNWTRGTSEMSTDKTYKATVTSDELNNEYVANFLTVGTTNISIPVSYNSSYGTVTYNGNAIDGTGIVAKENQEVTLVANPLAGYLFLGWTIERGTSTDTVTSESLTFIAEDGMRITAEFSLATVEYSIDTTNGALHNYDGNKYYELWKSNDERLTLTSPGEYTITSSMQLWCLGKTINYQLSVSDDFVITGYTLRYKKGSSGFNITLSAPGREDQTPGSTTAEQEFIVDNEDSSTTSFSLTGTAANQFIKITSFTVNVKKKGASDPEVTKYTVSVTAGTGGTASASATEVESGGTVVLTAEAAEGYVFDHWSIGTTNVSENNPYTATITANTEYTANFKVKPVTKYTVTVTAGTGGTASASATEVESGGTVVLTAEAADGYVFDYWSVGTTRESEDNPYTATITANTEFIANFKEVPSGEVEYCTPSGDTYTDNFLTSITTTDADVNVNYTASSHPGSALFVVPTVVEVAPGGSFNLNLVAKSLGAGDNSNVREDIRYCHVSLFTDFDRDGDFGSAISKWGNNGGTLPAPSHNVYGNYDEVMNISTTINVPATAAEGVSHIRVVYQNAWKEFPSACTTALEKGIAYDIEVRVVAKPTYVVTIDQPANGTVAVTTTIGGVAVTSGQSVNEGTELTLSNTPAAGYRLVHYIVNGVETTESTVTVNEAVTISAVFERIPTYVVTIETPENGTIAVSAWGTTLASGQSVNEGTVLTLSNRPTPGCSFVHYIVNGAATTDATLTVTEDVRISAVFEEGIDYCQPTGVDGRSSADNVTNFTDQNASNDHRVVSSLTLTDGQSTVTVNAAQENVASRAVYYDRSSTKIITTPGKTITVTVNTPYASGWMNTYAYVDFGSDGLTSSDYVYDNYTGGYNPVRTSFTILIPADKIAGKYRARYILDWENTDPCKYGQSGKDNGECVIDFTIEVAYEVTYSLDGKGDVLIAEDYTIGDGTITAAATGILATGSVIKKDICAIFVPKQYKGDINTIASVTVNGVEMKDNLTEAIYPKYESKDNPTKEGDEIPDAQCYYLIIPKSQVEREGRDQSIYVKFEGNVQDIDGIGMEDANGPTEYYNLQGVRVDAENLTPGFYIVRQGGKVAKVLIK